MEEKNFNGFASEAQYEAVLEIVKNEIDSLCDTLMVKYAKDFKQVELWVDDYLIDVEDKGIYVVFYKKETDIISPTQIEVFRRIDRIATVMFDVLN